MTPEEIAAYKVDKSTWARGPWDDEPDRVDFRHAGLPCLAVRHQDWGHWCGYVAVPKGHPAYGVDPFREDLGISADINYGAACSPPICHVPAPGEPDDVWCRGAGAWEHVVYTCPTMLVFDSDLAIDGWCTRQARQIFTRLGFQGPVWTLPESGQRF